VFKRGFLFLLRIDKARRTGWAVKLEVGVLKILLVGNYDPDQQQSMQRFAILLRDGLLAAGHEVRLIKPSTILRGGSATNSGLGKWLGYVDKFIFFPFSLWFAAFWADMVHVCDHSNAMYVGCVHGMPHVVTCHDVLAIRAAAGEIPASRPGLTGRILQRWILSGLRRAQRIVCVSEQTAKELMLMPGIHRDRVQVVSNAINYAYSPMPQDQAWGLLASLGLVAGQPYFLHVGGNQWYKNRLGVLRIFYHLAQFPPYAGHRLVMAGKDWTEEMRSFMANSGMQDRIVKLTELDNEQLRALYSMADALLFPSLYEGFGWPIIEAQACGTIVVTSARPPMSDVAGKNAAILVNPEEELAAADTIAGTLLADTTELQKCGYENSTRYSVDAMVSGYLDAYDSVWAS
jgi:glycosyltransferase involved in cell wall biosynthesis